MCSTEFSLSSSDLFSSNTSATVLEMEKIMTMIIEEREELARDLEVLIIATLDKVNQIIIIFLIFTNEGSSFIANHIRYYCRLIHLFVGN